MFWCLLISLSIRLIDLESFIATIIWADFEVNHWLAVTYSVVYMFLTLAKERKTETVWLQSLKAGLRLWESHIFSVERGLNCLCFYEQLSNCLDEKAKRNEKRSSHDKALSAQIRLNFNLNTYMMMCLSKISMF